MVRDDFVQQQKGIAERILPKFFGKLVSQPNEPFIQTIYDLSVPRMAFGRVCILGDAAFVLRPHTAAGVSKAATNAVTPANSITNSSNIDVIGALKRWEPRQIELCESHLEIDHSLIKFKNFSKTIRCVKITYQVSRCCLLSIFCNLVDNCYFYQDYLRPYLFLYFYGHHLQP